MLQSLVELGHKYNLYFRFKVEAYLAVLDRWYLVSLQVSPKAGTGDNLNKTGYSRKEHVCETCGAKFRRVRDFRNHSRIHAPEKLYQCTLCPRASSKKLNVKLHIISVHDVGSNPEAYITEKDPP